LPILLGVLISFAWFSSLLAYYGLQDSRVDQVRPAPGTPELTILQEEHQKAVNEIASDIQETYAWYDKKFYLVGAIVVVFLGYLGVTRQSAPPSANGSASDEESEETLAEARSTDQRLMRALESKTAFVGLGAATIVSFLIDIHIRQVISNLQGIGFWIRHVVEGQALPNGWEHWLAGKSPTSGELFLGTLNSASIHTVTWFVYSLFLFAGAKMVRGNLASERREGAKELFISMTSLTGLAFLMLVVAAHNTAPGFQRSIPFLNGLTIPVKVGIMCLSGGLYILVSSVLTWILAVGKQSKQVVTS